MIVRHDKPLLRHRHEPQEPEALDEVNTALDRIEADVRAIVAAGGEMPLRLRLARVLGGEIEEAKSARVRAGRRLRGAP